MSSTSPGPNDGRSRAPSAGRTAPPPVPSAATPAGIPSARTDRAVPASPRKPPPLPPASAAPARRSAWPVVLGCGLVTILALAAAAYFAVESFRTKDQLAEANRTAAKARDDYELAAGSLLQQREEEWAKTRATWANKEKELTARAADAERDRDAARGRASGDIDRSRAAQSQAEAKVAAVQSQLNSARQEVARLRAQVASSTRRTDELLRSPSPDIRNWFSRQFAALPPLDSQHEVRVALRKHEMSRLLDAERKKQEKLVYQAAGTLVLGNSEAGLAYRSAILQYATISSATPANVLDVKLVYRWSVPESATSLDPGSDNEIVSYTGVTGGSPDGTKDLRFDYRKTDERFQPLDAMSPLVYKGEKARMVFCLQFKEKGDPTNRWLIFKANTLERGK